MKSLARNPHAIFVTTCTDTPCNLRVQTAAQLAVIYPADFATAYLRDNCVNEVGTYRSFANNAALAVSAANAIYGCDGASQHSKLQSVYILAAFRNGVPTEALAASAQPAALVGSLATPQDRIECRDAATAAWHDCDDKTFRVAVVDALVALGFRAGYDSTCALAAVIVEAGDHRIVLEWDSMIDGFDYPTSTEDAEALEPADEDEDEQDTTCTCGDKRGMGTDDDGACRDCGGYA